MRAQSIDGVIISSPPTIRYFSGFTGSHAMCVVTARAAWFLTDSRYILQSQEEVHDFRRHITREGLPETVARRSLLKGCCVVAFESHELSVARYQVLKKLLPRIRLRPAADLFESVALVKEPAEIALLQKAVDISDAAFLEVLKFIRPAVTENEIAAHIAFLQKCAGAEGEAFDTIVASGPRAAFPHARASQKKIRNGELVILDFGCTVGGYHSDITRTVAVGYASKKAKKIYHIVLQAQEEAISAARVGMAARELDSVARKRIKQAGFGRYFPHSLGHGLGLRFHERPRVSPLGVETLQAGSVITIEPGIYIPGWGGVRIEDDVLLQAKGSRVLTKAPKELIIL
jgi:Xaa-Pro aminopeptidase